MFKSKKSKKKATFQGPTTMFGQPLNVAVQRSVAIQNFYSSDSKNSLLDVNINEDCVFENLPLVVKTCLTELDRRSAYEEEGLYRRSGSTATYVPYLYMCVCLFF